MMLSKSVASGPIKSAIDIINGFTIPGKAGVAGIIIIVLMAALAPFITFYGPSEISGKSLEPPGPSHILGTDELGMDIWSQLCYGARMSLVIGLAVALIAGLGGGTLGILAGYVGGIWDALLLRAIDITLALPSFPLLIVIAAFLGPSIVNVILVLVLFSWAKPARIARSQTLAMKKQKYVVSARLYGAGPLYIIRRHLLPEVLPLIFVSIVNLSSYAIVAESGLAFLGLGDPTSKSWGMMLYYATHFRSIYFTPYWQWWLIPPLVALIFLLLCLAFIGRDLERVVDPKLRKKGD
ncbi:ABC-type dipeptide/oligopeptide/nickel transport system, permease component [Methanocella conradii HZ254]|uniref:ABC-type dipeptide/oligopeptide/nickel transport system, permease component n=1 Tax=Methanocella conradii (strain DSM 24694 / JCM 17849 / CGMCC 1.5162 / HZ254) TaxID=1041930 RepID=H8IAS2_METCZ|nr:ABC transporter permease [Methanocella conradii]AFD00577.1 ABC-type dipeptide/oligopeptide/nickel transport system, permease component [Methanocella conradii HZ254]